MVLATAMLFSGICAKAQFFTVNQCSGTPSAGIGSSSYGPLYSTASANSTNRTAVIYPATQLTGVSGNLLSAIYYYRFSANGALTGSPNFKIYLKEVTNTDWGANFASWADTIASATLVFNGNPAPYVGTSLGWKGFPLTTGFTYSGTKNLAVLTEYTNATASIPITWTYEYTSPCVNTSNSNTTKYSNNTTGILPVSLSSSDYRRPYTGFDNALSCYPPYGVSATVTSNSSQLSWVAPSAAPAAGYEYYYNTSGTEPTAATVPTGTTAAGVTTASINSLTPGTTYYYWVRSACSGSSKSAWIGSSFVTSFVTPANDLICNATPVTVSTGAACANALTGQTTGGATAGPAACTGSGADDDVWYSFVANNTTQIISLINPSVTPAGSSNDRVHQIYSSSDNTCTGTLTSITCSDPEASTTTGLVVGKTYFVRVHSYSTGNYTTFDICISAPLPPPANDNICGAIALSVSPGNTCTTILTNQSTQSATQSLAGCAGTADEDVWYSFVAANATQNITLSNSGIGVTDRVHQVFSSSDNTCTGTLTSLLCSDPESSTLTGLTVGKTYFLRVYSYTSTVTSYTTFDICITGPTAPPANDNASGAIALTVGAGCTGAPYNNTGATLNTGEPYPSCSGTANSPVWFKFVAPASGAVRISTDLGTAPTFVDSKVGLFSATDPANYSTFSIISCDDDGGSAIGSGFLSVLYASGLTAGTTYYVAVDKYASSTTTGTYCIAVDELASAMLATTNTCSSTYQTPSSNSSTTYTGWVPLLDATSRLVALVRNPAGGDAGLYSNSQNVNTGAVRQSNGTYYLNRNYRISNTTATNVNVQLFFLNSELTALATADPLVTLANIGVTRQNNGTSTTCYNNVDLSGGALSFIPQTGNGTANGVNWINFTTPAFSNFYLNRAGTALPISLQYLKGIRAGTGNALNWKVNCTSVSITMELERSSDSRSFKAITSITATQARCGQPFDYTDASPLKGTNYYRLKMIDVDGRVTYSPIVAIINGTSGAELVGIYPTVVRDEAFVSVAASRSTKMQLNITDMSGRIIKTISETVANGSSLISINTANLSTGVYNITGMLDGVQTKTLRFVKQ